MSIWLTKNGGFKVMSEDESKVVEESSEEQQPTEDFVEPIDEELESIIENPWTRAFSVYTDPSRAMASVAAKGQWWVPMILIILAAVLFIFMAGDVLMEMQQEQGIERIQGMVESGRVSQEQADQIIEQQFGEGNSFTSIMMYVGTVVSIFFVKLVVAAIALLIGNIVLGGSRKFKDYWAVAFYASMIGVVTFILSAIMISMTGDMQSAQFGLGVLTKGDTASTIHKIAQVFDIFKIWEAIVLGIGVATLAKVSNSKGIIWMVIIMLGIGIITSLLFGQPMV
jgi:Yip1 domain